MILICWPGQSCCLFSQGGPSFEVVDHGRSHQGSLTASHASGQAAHRAAQARRRAVRQSARVPPLRRCVRKAECPDGACTLGAREAPRPRVPALRGCLRGGEQPDGACARGAVR